jgi:hypothetical protein
MLARWIAIALCTLIAVTQMPSLGQAFTPTSDYQVTSVHGFTVLVNQEVLSHPQAAIRVQKEVASQLEQIIQVVPDQALVTLQQVRIWVEWNARRSSAAEFHPSARWLRRHGYNPEKAGGVEVSNANNFVEWSRDFQPWMLLHELAHGYHLLKWGDDDRRIKGAYQHAIAQQLYDAVRYAAGGKRRAYAAVNNREYFAELSEAYFGRNDFYPFTRQQLAEYDPVGFRMMQERW